MTDFLQPAWFLELLARASAGGLSSVHVTKCFAFASKGILESLQSCVNLHFEEGDLKVVVLMLVFVITARLSFKKASKFTTLVCTAFVHLCYHTLLFRTGLWLCFSVLDFFSSPFFLMAVVPDFSVPESWEEWSSAALYCLSALSNPEF